MNKEKLIQLIESPLLIGKNELEDLEKLSNRFPWFFSSLQLQLYYHKNHNDIDFNDYLSKWSFYCPSPKSLYNFLNTETDRNPVQFREDIINETPNFL